MKFLKNKFFVITIMLFSLIFINGCGMGADARKYPPEPEKRVQKNMEEGKGFRLMDNIGKKVVDLQNLTLQVQMNYGEHLLIQLILCL